MALVTSINVAPIVDLNGPDPLAPASTTSFSEDGGPVSIVDSALI